MSRILSSNELNTLLIQKTLLEQKILDLKNELTHHINTLDAINALLETKCHNDMLITNNNVDYNIE